MSACGGSASRLLKVASTIWARRSSSSTSPLTASSAGTMLARSSIVRQAARPGAALAPPRAATVAVVTSSGRGAVALAAARPFGAAGVALPFAAVGAGRRAVATKAAATDAAEETFEYQAEVDRLMDMIVNSLYSNREVFLRELISNASDALDKARFVGLTKPEIMKGKEELEIRVSCDKDAKTITIEDSGIGMTKEQLLENLGTIARSGTKRFMEMMKEAKSAGENNLIGQFGVGFYSAFLVADRVTVVTKSAEEDKQWIWSAAAGSHKFTVKEDDNTSLVRGTRIVLHCKEDADELIDPVMLSRLIKQYSQFISFPIKLYSAKKEPVKVVDDEATKRKQEAEDKKAAEESREKTTVEPVMKTEYNDSWDWRTENENKPIWVRNPKDVSDETYNEFFKTTFSEFLDPLAHQHFNVEGTIEFSGILYIPGMAPFDQQQMQAAKSRNIKLYVKRVFISDEFDDNLMPRYLSFIKGVVDSSDLPLNVSREILQESRITRLIRKQLVKRSIDMISDLAGVEGGEDYRTFWENFGRNIKIGVIEDTENRDKLAKLVRFYSSAATEEGKLVSLDEYITRMKDGQKAIYYMAADNLDVARSAPFVEKLISKGYEVLYLIDPVDEAMVTNLATYDKRDLVDVSKEGLNLSDNEEDAKKTEEVTKEFAAVVDFLKKSLGERVEAVKVSDRLTDSPCALVTSKFGWSANMERIMKGQAFGDQRTMEYMKGRKIMEINPDSDIIKGLKTLVAEKDVDRARDLADLLFETSLLTSGFAVDSPRDYAGKVFTLMKIALGYDGSAESAPAAESAAPAPEAFKAAKAPKEDKSTVIEPEVVDPNDPWGGKNNKA